MRNLPASESTTSAIHPPKKSFILLFFLAFSIQLFAQVAINTDATKPDTSAMFDVKSTNSGILIPRMTYTQRMAIYHPAKGLLIYQVDSLPGFYYQSADLTAPVNSGEITPVWIQLATYSQTTIVSPLAGGPVLGKGNLSIPAADSLHNGYLRSSDWKKFNARDSITLGATTQYFRGDKSWQTLTSDVVPEGSTNRYFTEPRVLNTVLTGLSPTNAIISTADNVIAGFGHAQGQINVLINSKEPAISTGTPSQFYSWDKSWRTINYTMLDNTPDLSVYALKTTSITGNNGLTGGGTFAASSTIGHGLKTWIDKTSLSGATVISNLTIDTYGHPTNWVTRDLTPASIGAEPAISVLSVNKGGTGLSSMSTNTLLAGGTSSASPLQQLGAGLSGQLLQSNGNGNLPSWFDPTYISGNQNITLSGDVTGSGTTSISTTLASTGVTSGTYGNSGALVPAFTVDGKGRLTSSANRTLTPANIGAEPTITAGTATQYWRGDKTWQAVSAFILNQSTSQSPATLNITNSSSTVPTALITNSNASGTGVVGIGNGSTYTLYPSGAGGQFFGTKYGIYSVSNGSNGSFGGYFSNGTLYAYICGKDGSGTTYKILSNAVNSSSMVDKPDGGKVIMFSPETPEILFSDYGTGTLESGKCHITLDPIFSNNIFVSEKHPLKVFIQLEGECNGVYVTNKTAYGFDVIELKKGLTNVAFSWSVVANRNDIIDESGNMFSKNVGVRFPTAPKPPKLN